MAPDALPAKHGAADKRSGPAIRFATNGWAHEKGPPVA
jgi:hypothetical protein